MRLHRHLWGTILIPTLLVQAGTTMGNTFLPLYARSLGSSLAVAALVTALMFLGQALADLPGGWLVHRHGDRRVMLAGTTLSLLALALRLSVANTAVLVVSILLFGIGSSFIWTARMSWLKREVRGTERGYTMSFVGGSLRMANIIGPLIGGFVAELWGYRALFITQGLLVAGGLGTIAVSMPRSVPGNGNGYTASLRKAADAWKEKRGTILAATIGIGGLTVLRASREILFPLWAGELGLRESRVGIIMFAGAVVDASLFWLSGVIMTHLGRKAAAVACTTGLALAIGLLPAAGTMPVLLGLSILAGAGNAMGAGINLTVSGDLAPRETPEAFLSAWRFVMGFAGFGGPALAAWAISFLGNGAAPPLVGAAGIGGALVMALFMRETKKSGR